MSTLLQGVNDVLKKVHIIQGDSGELTTFTDSARQSFIDVAIQSWNEMIDDLYSRSQEEKAEIVTTGTITLVTDTRTYALATDVIEMYWPLHDQTNGRYIYKYEPGYLALVHSQRVPGDFSGEALYAAMDVTASAPQVYLDRIPTASENGDVYTYHYQKDSVLSAIADVMPFNEGVYRALIPAVSEIWRRHQNKDFDAELFGMSMGRAARLLNQEKQSKSWLPSRTNGG